MRRVMTEWVKEPGKYSLRALSNKSAEGKASATEPYCVVTKKERGARIRAVRAETRPLVSSFAAAVAVTSDVRSCGEVDADSEIGVVFLTNREKESVFPTAKKRSTHFTSVSDCISFFCSFYIV